MYLVVSFNYKNSDIETRGKLSILSNFYDEFKKFGEVIILSTCNRVELIFFTEHEKDIKNKILEISEVSTENADIYRGKQAIKHIFSVLSSLDSMVVGETQITGQFKNAFTNAYELGAVKKNLSRVMHFGFKCAKKIRNKTEISTNPVSVASIAIKKAKSIIGDLGGFTAVLIGAGDTSRIIAKHLEKEGVNLIILNRSYENALSLKEEIKEVNVAVHSIENIKKFINNYRLVFSATSANHQIIKNELISEKEFNRFWFDLAVPNDICQIEDKTISVFRVDDLKDISNENLQKREKELQEANKLIENCVQEYLDFIQSSAINPVLKNLRTKAETISKEVIQNAIKKGFIEEKDENEVTKIVYTAFKRFLHSPTITIKKNVNDPKIDILLSTLKKLFELDENMMDLNKCEYHLDKGIK